MDALAGLFAGRGGLDLDGAEGVDEALSDDELDDRLAAVKGEDELVISLHIEVAAVLVERDDRGDILVEDLGVDGAGLKEARGLGLDGGHELLLEKDAAPSKRMSVTRRRSPSVILNRTVPVCSSPSGRW